MLVNSNFNKNDDKYALKTEIPTSLPANGGNADTVDGLHADSFVKNTSDWTPMKFEITFGDHNYPRVSIDESIPVMPKVCNYTHIVSRRKSDDSITSVLSIPADYDDDIFLYQAHTGVWSNIGNAGTLDDFALKSEVPNKKDLTYLADVIRGIRKGWASTSTGTIMTYGDRTVDKISNELSYFGWTINSDRWFVPIVVSQYKDGVSYTMCGQSCNYDNAGSDCATFEYNNRTYYACWASPMSYQSPTVVGGLQLSVTDNDYINACKALIYNCERIASDEVISPSSKVKLYEDNEGGNLELVAPDGVHAMQMDLYNNEGFRMYFYDGSQLYFPVEYNFNTGKFNINGNADTLDGLHASDFVRAFNGSEMDNNRILIPNDVHVGNWLKANAEIGMQYYRYPGCSGQTGLPDGANDWAWFLYDGLTYMAKTVYNRFFIMDYINSYNGWIEIYTSKTKPYISGSATVAANSTTCTSNHGFTPSAVIWWDGNYSGVAMSFNGTQFTIDKTRPVDRIISYLIFK